METSAARRANRSAVLARLLASRTDGVTRAWLADQTRLSPATVSRVTDGLIAEGLVAEGAAVTSGHRGRNAVSLRVADAAGIVCGVDVGGNNCRMIAADLRGAEIARAQEATPVHLGAADLADWLAGRVAALAAEAGGPLRAVAMGLPGMVAEDGRWIAGAPNVPQIEGSGFAHRLTNAIGVPLTLDNDANLALLGEMRCGAGRGMGTVVMLAMGAGLGGGVAVDGRLRRGRSGMVGEFGYLPAGPSGELAEEFLSQAGLLRRAGALGARVDSVAEIFTGTGPAELRELFDRTLLLTLTAASAAYEPQAILIGGSLAPVIAERLAPCASRLRELLPAAPAIKRAELGHMSGALGAVVAACQSGYTQLGIAEEHAVLLPVLDR